MRWLLLTLALSQSAHEAVDRYDGQQLTTQFLSGDTAALWARMGPTARRAFGTEGGLKAFRAKVANDFGDEVRVSAERLSTRAGLTVYTRLSVFTRYALGVEFEWTWDQDGLVASLSAQPAFREAPSKYLEYQTKTSLRLPFEGSLNVLWGGRTWEDNRHASVPDMRFALDLLAFRGASSWSGDGLKAEQYFAWGRAVRAPAAGVVVAVENGVSDNLPNQPSTRTLYGNYLVIDHHNGEYSLLAHLMKGSVTVHLGDAVAAGQSLARVGNSGVSTEPHLHYQLMDSPDYTHAHGLPAQFTSFVADGKTVERGEPKRGQVIGLPGPAVR